MTINIIEKDKQPITLKETYELREKVKVRYPDAIVLLRRENEYYTFNSYAEIVITVIRITQPSLQQNKYECTVPLYELERFLLRLAKAGYCIAVYEPQFFNFYQWFTTVSDS